MSNWRGDPVNDDVDHITAKTRDKAMTLAENAKAIGLDPGIYRYNDKDDFVCFWFSNGLEFIIVFCSPHGYAAEIHSTDEEGEVTPEYSMIKNIRHFLYYVKKKGLISFDDYYKDVAEILDMKDTDIDEIISQYMDEQNEEE